MKILVSAIACDPNGGSEGGVGWNAVKQIARDHEVRLLTHSQNKTSFEKARSEGSLPPNIEVRYLCGNRPWHQNRMVSRIQSWLRYVQFSKLSLAAARNWHNEDPCDIVHQITYATWRVPSLLWRLPIPLVWGPIGGAGNFPLSLFSILGPSARSFELLRKINTLISLHSREFSLCARKAAVVLAANEETVNLLRPFRESRHMIRLPVVYLTEEKIRRYKRLRSDSRTPGPIRLFAGGNMIGSKGLALALPALALAKESGLDFIYTIAGCGPDIARSQAMAKKLNLENKIIFHPGYYGDEYIDALSNTDIFLMPSMRETAGITMIEAMLAGCYPIVADASAQGELIQMFTGTAVAVTDRDTMIKELCAAVLETSLNLKKKTEEIDNKINTLIKYFSEEAYHAKINEAYALCKN